MCKCIKTDAVFTKVVSILFAPLYIYIYILAIVFEGNMKGLFSIATTPMCKEGATSFPGSFT